MDAQIYNQDKALTEKTINDSIKSEEETWILHYLDSSKPIIHNRNDKENYEKDMKVHF